MSFRISSLLLLMALLAAVGCRSVGPYPGTGQQPVLVEDVEVQDTVAVPAPEPPLSRREPPTALPIPVDGVTVARLVHSWGDPRYGGRHHEGIDILAPRNTPVRSTTDGILDYKGMRGLGGQVVYVIGPGGWRHYYAHLEDFGPQRVGERVRQGDIIGYVGNSGNAAVSPTHLHYGIYLPGGQAIDPYPLLRASGQTLEARARNR
jgi:murein DD-endopeptidase MepM/ murein hydrolase activator NlpD